MLQEEAEKPSEERMSGYSERSFLISLEAIWRCAQKGSAAEADEMAESTSRESASKTQDLATSTRRAWWRRKSKPRMGTETGAIWKDQEKCLELDWSGIVRHPKQGKGAPPAVRRRVEEAGAEAVAVD